MRTNEQGIPTAEEIDALAQKYQDAVAAVEEKEKALEPIREELIKLIAKKGFTPKAATKSLRLTGTKWKCTLSNSDSVEIEGADVERFRAALKDYNVAHHFPIMFRRREFFVLAPKAHAYFESLCVRSAAVKGDEAVEKMRQMWHRCFHVKSNSPGLKVEPIEKEKEAKAS